MNGGAGSDIFRFSEFPDIYDIITDFNSLEDKIDLGALLTGNAVAYLGMDGSRPVLYLDPDGAGSAKSVAVAAFENTDLQVTTALQSVLV